MQNILLVTGSARKGRVANKILALVQHRLSMDSDIQVTVADLKDMHLPFFDNEHIPMSPEYAPTDVNVKKWSSLVGTSDAVLLLMPEYNHSMSAIQKNALDWLSTELHDKPVGIVGYGWSGGSRAYDTAIAVLGNLKADLVPSSSHLRFMKEIQPDGATLDDKAVTQQLEKTTRELINATRQ